MLDSPKNRRFYLTDSTSGVVELAKGIMPKLSPCVVMESSVEGGGTITRPNRNYPIYFFVRARKMNDGDAAAEAKEEAWAHARNFINFAPGNHAVFSRVEEWRLLFSLTLVLYIMFDGLLADVPDGGNEVAFRPEYLVTSRCDAACRRAAARCGGCYPASGGGRSATAIAWAAH